MLVESREVTNRALLRRARAFVIYHLGKRSFNIHTPQDLAAWHAFVHLLNLYGRCDCDHGSKAKAILAMALVLKTAQLEETIHKTFVQAIPAVLGWGETYEIWPQMESPFTIWYVNRDREAAIERDAAV